MRGDSRDTGSDEKADRFELTQSVHHSVDPLGICSLRVKNGLGIVEDDENLLGGKEGPQGHEILRILDLRTNDLGEPGEELRARSGELVATNESTVVAEPVLDAIMVEDSESDICFPNSSCTDESDWFGIFRKFDNVLDQLFASETRPGRRGR